MAVGGATLIDGIAAGVATASSVQAVRESFAAFAYALVFSALLGPLAFAALGSGSRAGGYLTLLAVLGVPELIANWTVKLLPEGWHELTSITAALGAIHHSIASRGASCFPMVRATLGVMAVIAASLLVIRARWIATESSRGA
jgi:hypothetical protein